MKIEEYTMYKLIADEGKILTDRKAFGKEVFLANNNPESWYEITEKEYNRIKEEQALAIEG